MKLLFLLITIISFFCSCTTIHRVKTINSDTYTIPVKQLEKVFGKNVILPGHNKLKVELTATDTSLLFVSPRNLFADKKINIAEIDNLRFLRYSFDIDIITLPFKVRPAVKGFPQQLNPNFSAAMYLGKRIDNYYIKSFVEDGKSGTRISNVGFGLGIFTGLGSVTMNPFVTQNFINYEYDGFVVSTGLAGIYDARRFNIGLAFGIDRLVDKNNKYWIYQNKPWIGILFGLNLN